MRSNYKDNGVFYRTLQLAANDARNDKTDILH